MKISFAGANDSHNFRLKISWSGAVISLVPCNGRQNLRVRVGINEMQTIGTIFVYKFRVGGGYRF